MLSEWFMYFVKKYKNIFNNIIFSGGLSMNVKANLKIQQIAKKYNKFFSQPHLLMIMLTVLVLSIQ